MRLRGRFRMRSGKNLRQAYLEGGNSEVVNRHQAAVAEVPLDSMDTCAGSNQMDRKRVLRPMRCNRFADVQEAARFRASQFNRTCADRRIGNIPSKSHAMGRPPGSSLYVLLFAPQHHVMVFLLHP